MYTENDIQNCMQKVKGMSLHETVEIKFPRKNINDSEIKDRKENINKNKKKKEEIEKQSTIYVKSYYAGHVIGAAMFLVTINDTKVLYTGYLVFVCFCFFCFFVLFFQSLHTWLHGSMIPNKKILKKKSK